jgi:hypothetical protein
MALAPVDYGPTLHEDQQGIQELEQQRAAVFRDVHNIGSVVEGGAHAITQGLLHTQALKATAAVKERQAQTLQYIDSNPYVSKTDLQQKMSPEDYEAWHSGLTDEYKNADAVPMYSVAGALFDSSAKQAREDVGKTISLPGWRAKWTATEQTESATIRERYVNRLAADQMIADQRAQTLQAVDKMVDGAVKPEDIQAAATAAETSPWLKPAERRFMVEKVLAAKDSFVARQAMLGGDTEVMATELAKLRGPNAAEQYPNMNVKQRLDLVNQLLRENSFKAAKATAEKIVGPNVDENGHVNHTGIEKSLAAYNGPDKEGVTKAVRAEAADKTNIENAANADLHNTVLSAGQNPQTGRFSYARAYANPDARKAIVELNKYAPGLIVNLSREDQRWDNIDAKQTALERREAAAALKSASQENLDRIHAALDDESQSQMFKGMTKKQFETKLYEGAWTESDRQKARTAFDKFLKNGGPDERAGASVAAELFAAANGNKTKTAQLKAKYGDALTAEAHKFIRENQNLPPDKLTDALRSHLHDELLSGKVPGTGRVFDDTVRRIEFETNPKYTGKTFQPKDGSAAVQQRIELSKGGKTMSFPAADAAAARADGWK